MIIIQLILFCALFTIMVRLSALGGSINALYFYPKHVQDKAIELHLIKREDMDKKKKRFMPIFYLVIIIALLLIIGLWNGVSDFKNAYLQSLLFLEVMTWFDGIFIDKVWVKYSSFWVIPELKGIPYVQTWPQVFKKRITLSFIMLIAAAILAGLVILIF